MSKVYRDRGEDVMFSGTADDRRTLDQIVAMRPVVAEQGIVLPKQDAQCRRHRLLADAELRRAAHLVRGMVLPGKRLFATAQP